MFENYFGPSEDPHGRLVKEIFQSVYDFLVTNPIVTAAATIIVAQVYKWVSPFFKDADEVDVDVKEIKGDDDDNAYSLGNATQQELITRIQALENREGTESVRRDVVELYRLVNILDRATGQLQTDVAALKTAERERKNGTKLA